MPYQPPGVSQPKTDVVRSGIMLLGVAAAVITLHFEVTHNAQQSFQNRYISLAEMCNTVAFFVRFMP